MRGEEIRELARAGVLIGSIFAGKKRKRTNAVLANLGAAVDLLEGLGALRGRMNVANNAGRGVMLTPEETQQLTSVLNILGTLGITGE